jgi:hypothetical protein
VTADGISMPPIPTDRVTAVLLEDGEWLGIGRGVAYKAARNGELPVLQFGARLVVPVPKLLAMLGADDEVAS